MFYDYVLLIEIVAMLIGGLGSSDTILNILRIIQANVCSNWPSDIREDFENVYRWQWQTSSDGKNSSELKKCKNATKDYTYTGV